MKKFEKKVTFVVLPCMCLCQLHGMVEKGGMQFLMLHACNLCSSSEGNIFTHNSSKKKFDTDGLREIGRAHV